MLVLLDIKEVSAATGKHHIHIRRMVKEGKFPVPVSLPIPHEKRPKLYFHQNQVDFWIGEQATKKAGR